MTDEKKFRQMKKEAAFTGLALLALILFWLVAGFGAAKLDVTVLHLPLWALTSSIGVWFAAIVLVKFLTGKIFKDMDLDDGENDNG